MTRPDPETVAAAIRRHLTPDLLHKDWRPGGKFYKPGKHPHFGYCNVASQALYWILGAKEAGYKPVRVQHEGATHWWVRASDGQIWDLTAEQFETPVPYEDGRAAFFPGRGYQPSKAAKILIERVKKDLEEQR